MRAVNPGALILAAGFSRRLGRAKQEILLGGETLLARAVRIAQAAGLDPVIVVVRDPHHMEQARSFNATVLLNERAQEGMATSVITGVLWAGQQGLPGLVLMTCDQPALRPGHLRALCATPDQITGSRYAGRNGVPAYFPSSAFSALLELTGDAGARSLLQNAATIPDESLALDIDTEADLQQAEQLLNPRGA